VRGQRPPLAVTIIAWLYIAVGAIGFAYHAADFDVHHPFQNGVIWIELIRLTADVCGVYLLLGRNWARWLALAWMAFHVVLSAFNSWGQVAFHAVICAVIAWCLFRPASARYFRMAAGA
jgi:hypothetical protein